MPVIAMTRERGSLGTAIGVEVARRLGYEFVRNEVVKEAAREYRVMEARLIGAVEEVPRLFERFRRRGRRYRAYLEAAVLDAALRERVLLMGRWSTIFLRGIPHAVRIRVCAPAEIRARRVMERLGVDHGEALRRIAAYDDGVRARLREMFDLDWTDPLLYDLVINTEAVTLEGAVRQIVALVGAPEFQPTQESQGVLRDRALAARVRAILKASATTRGIEVDVHALAGQVRLDGVVASDDERDAVVAVTRDVKGVVTVASDVKIFRRPVR